MTSIIFWNVARSGGKEQTLSTQMLCEDLAGLTETFKPDAIVLCECMSGFSNQSYTSPSGYEVVKPKFCNRYPNDNTLRYALLKKSNLSCSGEIIVSSVAKNKLRPALGVHIKGERFLALHAASITGSNKVQLSQMATAYDKFAANGQPPLFLVGDFNIDLNTDRSKVSNAIQGTSLEGFKMRAPKENTHRNREGEFVSKLDWAMLSPNIAGRAKVSLIKEQRSAKRRKNTALLKLDFDNLKNSDHRPIMVSW